MAKRSILFVHDNFPAQFGQFGGWLAARGWEVAFATAKQGVTSQSFRILPYKPHREPSAETHPYAQSLDKAAINAQGFARTAYAAYGKGYRPDIVMAHAGWGAGMFAKDIFPQAVSAPFCEWWYRTPAPDSAFLARSLPQREQPVDTAILQDARNAPILFDLANADLAFCPTKFQAAQFPPRVRSWLTVLHDGVDTVLHAPNPAVAASTLEGLVPEGAEVVTYATRGNEPHRGFPQFIRALPALFAARPKAHAVIVGENRVAYGDKRLREVDWRAKLMEEVAPDPSRVHFTGPLPREKYIAVLQRSDAHVYLTAPFVLSWSMLESMSIGCLLVASDTDPVREFATDGETALLTDFFDHDRLAARLIEALEDRAMGARLRAQARARIVETVAAPVMWRRKLELLEEALG
jgi:glycosyltransferase involved in cell wall biosynthesis